MKRIHILDPGTGAPSLHLLRRAAVALGEFAVNGQHGRSLGDPVHEWVTEGRRKQWEDAHNRGDAWAQGVPYSSCGDLAHWLLACLGCREEIMVNRTNDGGVKDWKVCVNLSRLSNSPYFSTMGLPMPGDTIYVEHPAHVAVVLDVGEQWITADFGQPYGARRVCQLRETKGGLQVRGRTMKGFVSLARMFEADAFKETAWVPDDFVGGVEDDCPYSGNMTIPVGI